MSGSSRLAFARPFVAGFRAFARTWRDERTLAARIEGARTPLPFTVDGRYLVTTDRGLFALSNDGFVRICPIPAFGIALAGETIYLAAHFGDATVVLAGALDTALRQGSSWGWRELLRIEPVEHGGRIHQIAADGDTLWICDTHRNLLSKHRAANGEHLASIAPFRCSFGHPIVKDHNHINGVMFQPGYLVFSAFRINKRSAFGLVGDGLVRLYAHANMGVHDCAISGDDFWFSDSYRMFDGAKGGVVHCGAALFCPEYFERAPAAFVRGIAGHGDEVIVGNSFTGSRDRRFEGNGEIIRFSGGKPAGRSALPCAQVYDIVRLADGRHFETPPGPKTAADAERMMTAVFGPPVEIHPLRDLCVGRNGKKTFSDADVGRLAEYL